MGFGQDHHDHENKMCALTCCPCHLDIEAIKPLVDEPKAICTACGRVANDEDRLCRPSTIE